MYVHTAHILLGFLAHDRTLAATLRLALGTTCIMHAARAAVGEMTRARALHSPNSHARENYNIVLFVPFADDDSFGIRRIVKKKKNSRGGFLFVFQIFFFKLECRPSEELYDLYFGQQSSN